MATIKIERLTLKETEQVIGGRTGTKGGGNINSTTDSTCACCCGDQTY